MSNMSERLKAIAKAKGDFDVSHGRKPPVYGKDSEIETRAAYLLDEAETALAAIASLPLGNIVRAKTIASAILAKLRGAA